MNVPSLVFAACLTGSLCAQELTWAEGANAADLTVLALPTAQPGASARTVLTQVQFVPIEITNRTAQQSLRDDVSRLVERSGLRRVALGNGGSLYAYRRSGGQFWGFLWTAADGTARVVLERPGQGLGGTQSPFLDRVGVAPDGLHAAVTLTDESVLAVRLDGGDYASTNAPWRPVNLPARVEDTSLCAGTNNLVCGTQDDRVWRVSWADGAVPQDVSPPPVPNLSLKSEFAPSADGEHVVFLYGPDDLESIWLLGDTGPAVALPPPPGDYEEPYYLPDATGGPRLFLDDDSSHLLYIDGSIRDEAFLLDISGSTPTTHVTGDHNFQPYIGVVVLPIAFSNVFVAGIGDPQRFDLYAATTTSATVGNLTVTNGTPVPPYTSGNLVPRAMSFTERGVILTEVTSTVGGPAQLWSIGGAGANLLAHDVTDSLRRGAAWGSCADFHVGSSGGDALLNGDFGAPVAVTPPGIALSTSVVGHGDHWRMVMASAGNLQALAFLLSDGSLIAVPLAGDVTEAVVTQAGELALNGTQLHLIDGGGTRNVAGAAVTRWVLSGQGTSD